MLPRQHPSFFMRIYDQFSILQNLMLKAYLIFINKLIFKAYISENNDPSNSNVDQTTDKIAIQGT